MTYYDTFVISMAGVFVISLVQLEYIYRVLI